jgi:hypothetical protein
MKGKTVRRSSEPVMTAYVKIPPDILSMNNNVTLAADIMFVNGLPFMISVPRKIKMTTAEHMPNRKVPSLIKSLKKFINLYKAQGFIVHTALMDIEFECLKDDFPGINLNTTAMSDNVPEVERKI